MSNVITFPVYPYGKKYDRALDIASIAKLVRAEVKNAIKLGRIPECKVSVTISRYSGGQSMSIRVTAASFNPMNPNRRRGDWQSNEPIYTEQGSQVLKTLRAIANQWNYDRSDSQIDYFDTNFYVHEGYDWKLEEACDKLNQEQQANA